MVRIKWRWNPNADAIVRQTLQLASKRDRDIGTHRLQL